MKNPSSSGPLSSSVFKKFTMAVSGLALVGFVITHLLGNVLLYLKDGEPFNNYAHKLESFGVLLYAAEIGLLFFFLFHAFSGLKLWWTSRAARPVKYEGQRTKGGPTRWTIGSTRMALSGAFLFAFLVFHVLHFKYGPGMAEGYVAQVPGPGGAVEARDLHRHVAEQFQRPEMVAIYVVAMLFLGMHLRHGIWSAFQSLGLTREHNSGKIYLVGGLLGALLCIGFLFIPIYIYFFNHG